jgi:hypothetical protein
MNVSDMEADMVPSLARDHPHTYEPIASRAPPKALANPAHGAPHTDEFGSLGPEPNQTRTCMGILSLKRRSPFIPQEDSWYSFMSEAESTPGP